MRYVAWGIGIIAAMACTSASSAMSSYKWKKRPLLIFAASAGSKQLTDQRRILANSLAELAARDVVVVWIVGSDVSARLGRAPSLSGTALRARYGVAAHEFKAVLVGKDAGVKLSSATPLSNGKLFSTIDAMAMRRDEIRKR